MNINIHEYYCPLLDLQQTVEFMSILRIALENSLLTTLVNIFSLLNKALKTMVMIQ